MSNGEMEHLSTITGRFTFRYSTPGAYCIALVQDKVLSVADHTLASFPDTDAVPSLDSSLDFSEVHNVVVTWLLQGISWVRKAVTRQGHCRIVFLELGMSVG